MGKSETIVELQSRLVAVESVLFSVSKLLGVELKTVITMRDVAAELAKMNAAITNLREEASYAPEERGHSTLNGGSLQVFDEHEIDREIDRQSKAVARTSALDDLAQILSEIQRDLGINGSFSLLESASMIASAIATMKGSGDIGGGGAGDGEQTALTKGDTFAQAWEHNSKMRDHLGDELKGARMIIQRIANALQVQSYDQDGTELIERVQRWENLKYTLKRRRLERISAVGTDDDPVVAEQTHLLAFLIAPKMLAEWIARKGAGVVGAGILEAADHGNTRTHAEITLPELQKADLVGAQHLVDVFDEIKRSRTASAELLLILNRVIIPLVERQAATQRPIAG